MAAVFKLVVSTSDGRAFDGEAQKIVLRGVEGDFAILADHAPFMTLVKPCRCVITDAEGKETAANISSGAFQVSANKATLLVGKYEITE